MTDILHMLLGAALVAIGVLASALADRIRGGRFANRNERPPIRESTRALRAKSIPAPTDLSSDSDDVIAALMDAGYKKAIAIQAALTCTEREQATPESWMAAALRRCAQGGAS